MKICGQQIIRRHVNKHFADGYRKEMGIATKK